MASNSSKTPLALSKWTTYDNWLKVIKVLCFTAMPPKQQGSAFVLSLEDEALDAVLEINDAEIAKDDGADTTD